jgi:hypothetical protein
MPSWATDLRRLSALMAYSAFIGHVKLEKVDLNRFIEAEEEIKQGMYLINS